MIPPRHLDAEEEHIARLHAEQQWQLAHEEAEAHKERCKDARCEGYIFGLRVAHLAASVGPGAAPNAAKAIAALIAKAEAARGDSDGG